jgi:hypothetical protein
VATLGGRALRRSVISPARDFRKSDSDAACATWRVWTRSIVSATIFASAARSTACLPDDDARLLADLPHPLREELVGLGAVVVLRFGCAGGP